MIIVDQMECGDSVESSLVFRLRIVDYDLSMLGHAQVAIPKDWKKQICGVPRTAIAKLAVKNALSIEVYFLFHYCVKMVIPGSKYYILR